MTDIENNEDGLIIDDLDTSWLDDFDKLDSEYKNYYKDTQLYIRIQFIYINSNNEIIQIRDMKHFFSTPNSISKEELIAIIKNNSISADKLYSLLSILKYNIDIEPQGLKSFLKSNYVNDGFLQSIKNIDTICFNKSISMFHDINALFIILYEKQKILAGGSNKNITKKVFITSNTKKFTRRKQFKAITVS